MTALWLYQINERFVDVDISLLNCRQTVKMTFANTYFYCLWRLVTAMLVMGQVRREKGLTASQLPSHVDPVAQARLPNALLAELVGQFGRKALFLQDLHG